MSLYIPAHGEERKGEADVGTYLDRRPGRCGPAALRVPRQKPRRTPPRATWGSWTGGDSLISPCPPTPR